MQRPLSRTLRITMLCLALFAAMLLLFALATTEIATATTTYELGEDSVYVHLDYGAEPSHPILRLNGEDKYFKIVNYVASATKGGTPFDLVEDGKVTAVPSTTYYYMVANGNAIPWDVVTDSPLEDYVCSGTILVTVGKNSKTVYLSASSLSKIYGDAGDAPVWSKDDLSVTFDSAGRAATASVGTYDDFAPTLVTLSGVDRTEYYTIDAKVSETSAKATYSVLPREISLAYDAVDEVNFNDYLLEDGESVAKRTVAGKNGEEVTGYFRIKEEHAASLTVGVSYEIELYRYEVKPAEGDPVSYLASVESNYRVTPLYTEKSVKAKAGSVTIYQDEALREERDGDPHYLYLPLSTFSYTYFDLIRTDLGEVMTAGESLALTVTLYPGVTGTIRCRIDCDGEGYIPVGAYPMEMVSFECEEIEALFFDESVRLVVDPLVLSEAYDGTDEAEITLADTFDKAVTRKYKGLEYTFRLTADLTGKKVGDELPYASILCLTDPNLLIPYGDARVKIVKRTQGVELSAEKTVSVAYGEPIGELAALLVGGESVKAEEATVVYSYCKEGSSLSYDGLPTAVGSYDVTCAVSSDLFEVEPLHVGVTVTKRRVAALYQVTAATKTYGTTYEYKSGVNVQLMKLFDLDPAGKADREKEIPTTADERRSYFSGSLLSSAGGAADAEVGEYPFVFGAQSSYFEVMQGIVVVYANGEESREISGFTVVPAPAPAVPTAKYDVVNGREIRVTVDGRFKAEISRSEAMTSATSLTGSGSVVFKKIAQSSFLYGEVFYLRVQAEANKNYEHASAWSEATRVAIPFAAPSVALSDVTDSGATFTALPLSNAVEGYVLRCRVGSSGEWKDGLTVDGLRANASYTVYFRAEKNGVIGTTTSIGIRTLRTPVAEDAVAVKFDRSSGDLTVNTEVTGLEYCLCSSSGEVLVEWTDNPNFSDVLADGNYLLKVRYAETENALSSAETVIEIDTHRPKEPLTFYGVVRDWFLVLVGGFLLVMLILFIVIFVKHKKKTDREEA